MPSAFENIKKNPVVIVISAAIAASSATFGAVNYFYSEKVSLLKLQYQIKAKSIDRGISTDSLFDVSNILVDKDDKANLKLDSSNVREFTNDRFLAVKPIEGWEYQKIDEYSYLSSLLDAKKLGIRNTGIDTHLWKYEDSSAYIGEVVYKYVYPHIVAQRISLKDLRALLKSQIDEQAQAMQKVYESIEEAINNKVITLEVAKERLENALRGKVSHEEKKTIIKQMEEFYYSDDKPNFYDDSILFDSMFAGDVVALIFLKTLGLDIRINSPPMNKEGQFELLAIQKKRNVLYMKSKAKIAVTNNGGEKKKISLYKENIIVSTRRDLYLIDIYLPTESLLPKETNGWKFTQLWLENFRIIE